MEALQFTFGPCKLSIVPLVPEPELELTDFATDITWVSGPIYARVSLTGEPSQRFYVLEGISWDGQGSEVSIQSMVGPLKVRMNYCAKVEPPRLEETVEIQNLSEETVTIGSIRIGLTWTPPLSWWGPWSSWQVIMIPGDADLSEDIEALGRPLSSLSQLLESNGDVNKPVQVIPKGMRSRGWIITDGKRFLAVGKKGSSEESLPLDIFRMKKQPPPR